LRLILKFIMSSSCLSLSLIFPSTRTRLAVQALQIITFPPFCRQTSLVAFYLRLIFLFRYAVAANIFKAFFLVSSIKGNKRKVKPKGQIVLAHSMRPPTGSRGSPPLFSSTRRQMTHLKSTRYPLNRKFGGPRDRYGLFREQQHFSPMYKTRYRWHLQLHYLIPS